jgi:nucleoside-diphosphate-sugar epimerase
LADLVYDAVGNGRIAPEFQPARPGDVRRHSAGTKLAEKIIGLHTQITVEEGIRRLVAYLRAMPGGAAGLLEKTQAINWTPVSEKS